MLASPHTTASGQNPFADLLFSPRAAFVWDHGRHAIAWMNAAARLKFGLDAHDLSALLLPDTTRHLLQCDGQVRGHIGTASRAIRFEIAHHRALDCSVEPLELAGGRRGAIVIEAATAQRGPKATRSRPKPPKTAPAEARSRRPEMKSSAKPGLPRPPVPELSPEELRSFMAIGRKVRRLCQEKQRTGSAAPARRASPRPAAPGSTILGAQAVPALLFSAFDAVLFLNGEFAIVGSQGWPNRLGWSKSNLLGKPAAGLLAQRERAIFERMAKKLDTPAAQISKGTLSVNSGNDAAIACRAILGHWTGGGARYFLALLSLAMPRRLQTKSAA